MPKEGRDSSPISENGLKNEDNVKEWEEARCPVCLDHPHNAVLLLCSSHDKGCHPFMCDSGDRHSNCFHLFKKSFTKGEGDTDLFLEPLVSAATIMSTSGGRSVPGSSSMNPIMLELEEKDKPKLMCPMCRGNIMGWIVVDSARCFMDGKARSCTYEECDFSGTYSDLQKHAETEHTSMGPAVADPVRQKDWQRLERVRDFGDLVSSMRSPFTGENAIERNEYADSELLSSLRSENAIERNEDVASELLTSLRSTLIEANNVERIEYADIELLGSRPESADNDELLHALLLVNAINVSSRNNRQSVASRTRGLEAESTDIVRPSAQSIGSSGNVVVTSGRRSRRQRGESPDGEIQYRSERESRAQRRRRARNFPEN